MIVTIRAETSVDVYTGIYTLYNGSEGIALDVGDDRLFLAGIVTTTRPETALEPSTIRDTLQELYAKQGAGEFHCYNLNEFDTTREALHLAEDTDSFSRNDIAIHD